MTEAVWVLSFAALREAGWEGRICLPAAWYRVPSQTMADQPLDTSTQPLDTSTRLAVDRTRMAAERTMMAWIRTSTSLIAFGFTIFQFFKNQAAEDGSTTHLLSPWAVGMLMIVIGLAALTLGWFQHRLEMKALRAEGAHMPYSLAGVISALIATLGLLALVVVGWRL